MQDVLQERGVCMFAYNTPELDYIQMAVICAKYVKRHLGLPVCLITDAGGESWLKQSHSESDINEYIDYIVETNDEFKENKRTHWDSPWTEFNSQFNNSNKHKVWDYSPFEKTLLIDTDYIIKTNFLSNMFDNVSGVSMFKNAISLRNQKPLSGERELNTLGVPMWWSTVVYFDRSDVSEMFFSLWSHVADNYRYYQHLYNFPGKVFRTDYCVSIAVHILNGMQQGDMIEDMFGSTMQNMSSKDDIVGLESLDTWFMLAHNPTAPWENILVKHEDYDVHVMNKRAWVRNYNKFIDNGEFSYE